MPAPENSVTVLGCDGSYPSAGGAASGYLVRSGGAVILLDAGPGTFANLQRFADPAAVDAVVLSHEHPDHWTDLESLAVWLRLGRDGGQTRPDPLPILAPPGLRQHSFFAADPRLDWREVEPGYQATIDGLEMRFALTDHGPPTMAVHLHPAIDAAGVGALVYSADTGPEFTVGAFGDDIAVVLCEATYTRQHEGRLQHLSGRQAGLMAADAGVGRLVLTHRWPTVSAEALRREAEEAFGRSVEQSEIGAVFTW